MSKCIVKTIYIEKPKYLIIWNGVCYIHEYTFKLFKVLILVH